MEKIKRKASHEEWNEKISDLCHVFGKDFTKLLDQINHDNPTLSDEEVILWAWSLISEATAYMQPADPETLLENAVLVHEGYEAFRRIQE